MELKELCEKAKKVFEISDISELSDRLLHISLNNQYKYMDEFVQVVEDLSVDWLQKIFQYYEADRKEKKQDYTPKSLADFVGKLAGDSDTIIDMCAGSGALTIQKWNSNHNLEFLLFELDKNVIPFLLFNMQIRNIECVVFQSDVLQQEIFQTYKISKGKKYGICQEVR